MARYSYAAQLSGAVANQLSRRVIAIPSIDDALSGFWVVQNGTDYEFTRESIGSEMWVPPSQILWVTRPPLN